MIWNKTLAVGYCWCLARPPLWDVAERISMRMRIVPRERENSHPWWSPWWCTSSRWRSPGSTPWRRGTWRTRWYEPMVGTPPCRTWPAPIWSSRIGRWRPSRQGQQPPSKESSRGSAWSRSSVPRSLRTSLHRRSNQWRSSEKMNWHKAEKTQTLIIRNRTW